jgi:hypothetical protein
MKRQKESPERKVRTASVRRDARFSSDVVQLRKQLNGLRGYVIQIAINAHRMGLHPEALLSIARRELKSHGAVDADRLVAQYLERIGLLAKLDANVRGLAR